MCGIAGILSLAEPRPATAADAATMAATLVHRGPDDAASWADARGRCALGFRRLSIIDLVGGRQPIASEDGRVQVIFNGEIYNFRALRRELEAAGHRFATNADSEVIVHGYEQWGDGVFARLEGMFAIGVWDDGAATLTLARDRLGQKPLLYAEHDGRLYFASELKALLALPEFPRELDPQALHEYLLFQYVPAPRSILRHVQKLLPGHFLKLSAGARASDAAQQRYWRVPAGARFDGSYDDAKQRLGELLTAAVEKRLVADVPLGAFLSGGVDSSIVVGLMRRLGASPLRTFAIGFPDARYDETAHAARVAARFDTEHHVEIVTPDAEALLETLSWHYDEPFADSSAIPTYYVSRSARRHVTVALTGDAGDECFAGYDRYRAAQLAAPFDAWPAALRRLAGGVAGLIPHGRAKSLGSRAFRFLSAIGMPASRRYLSWVNVLPPSSLQAGYRAAFASQVAFAAPLSWFDALYATGSGDAADCAIHADLHSYLPYDLLTKVDIASMAVGLECRAPFLDHALVEFAVSLPIEWRLGKGGQSKRILKDWARDLLPPEILSRPKMGFGVPIGEWFRGPLRARLERELFAADALAPRVFDRAWLRSFVDAHLSSRANHAHALWALLMLELWRQRFQPQIAF